MTQEFEYIDSYFKGLLSKEEMKIFDQRLTNEPDFAENVAFYLSAHNAARMLVHEEKRNRFRQIQVASSDTAGRVVNRWLQYAAAAAVIGAIILVSIFYFNNPSPQKLAHQYVEREFTTLGVTMNSAEDSMQRGVRLYNEGQLEQALMTHERIIQKDSTDNLAIKYAGIVSLRLKQYDKALAYFQTLENIPGLFANPGKFYSAITLLERNQPGDKSRAKKLLQEVVENNLEGKDTAEKWLKEW